MSDWIHQPHNSEFLGNPYPRKRIGTIRNLGAIGKREYENDVVWITLQYRQFKWKKVKIPKVKGYGTDAMSILYDNTNRRETFFELDIVQDIEKQNNICANFLS